MDRSSPQRGLRSLDPARGALIALALSLLLPPVALAAGGGAGGGSTGFSNTTSSPGQRAIRDYKSGERSLDKARKLRAELVTARAEGDEKKAAKLEKKLAGTYAKAEKRLRKAIDNDESLHQAWTALGYTLRHQGRWDESLAAYDRAIELEPRYVEAVEYRAEAYLELGRIEDAKAGYVELVDWARPMAERLMSKMERWVETHSAEPGDVDPAEVAALASWIETRRASDGEHRAFSEAERATW